MFPSQQSDQIFSTILLPSEKILWTGKPNPGQAAKRCIPLVLFGTVWTAGSSLFPIMGVWTVVSGQNPTFGIVFTLFSVPFVLVGLFLLTSPYWASKTAKNTYFAITDKRAISVDNGKTKSVRAYDLADLGTPYIVGGDDYADIHWSMRSVAPTAVQTLPTTRTAREGYTITTRSSGTNNRFEFTCLSDAKAAFNVANSQNQVIEEQKHKADPLGLDSLRTMCSQGKMYVFSGLDMYEFDGTRVKNRKNIAKQAGFVVGPIILCVVTIFGLNFATEIVRSNGGFFGLIQPTIFLIILVAAASNVARGGGLEKVSTAMGQPVDFSNAKVIERLKEIYSEGCGELAAQRDIVSKIFGYIIGTVFLGIFAALLLAPVWSSFQELQKALQHPHSTATSTEKKPIAERIDYLNEQVESAEEKLEHTSASKKVQLRNLNTLAYRRECLAAAQIEGSLPVDAAESYAKALPERYQQLQSAVSRQSDYDLILSSIGLDAVWYADCLRDLKKLKEIDKIAPKLISEIESTSKANNLDPLTEKQVLIKEMAKAVSNAGYNNPQIDAEMRLKKLQTASASERDAAYNKLISDLLDAMH